MNIAQWALVGVVALLVLVLALLLVDDEGRG